MIKEQWERILPKVNHQQVSRGWGDKYYPPYYRPENPREIKQNKKILDEFLAESKPTTLKDKIKSLWR